MLPQYRVILKNDEVNSIDKVLSALMILCNLEPDEAIKTTMDIHHFGHGIVKTTHFELAETLMTKLNKIGLSAYIEKDLI